MSAQRNSVTVRADMSALDSFLDELGDTVEEAVRPAAQAGAQVLYDEVKKNVAAIGKKTGNLQRSIYQAFSKDNSIEAKAVYHVSWNARKAPHGHLVEYGHLQRYEISFNPKTQRFMTHKDRPLPGGPRQIAAKPFVRPAMARFEAAMEAAKAELMRRIAEKTK